MAVLRWERSNKGGYEEQYRTLTNITLKIFSKPPVHSSHPCDSSTYPCTYTKLYIIYYHDLESLNNYCVHIDVYYISSSVYTYTSYTLYPQPITGIKNISTYIYIHIHMYAAIYIWLVVQ